MSAIRDTAGGVEVAVWVVPGANRTEVKGIHGDAVRIRVAAPASGNRANDAVLALVSALLGTPVTMVRGRTSRTKLLRVRGITSNEARRRLGVGAG